MGTIWIKGLEISARHGVNESEKVQEQPFVFDVELTCDLTAAAKSDELSDTVNYAAVCKTITEIAKNRCYNLIEKLAAECAYAVLDRFPAVKGVAIGLNKPRAPMDRKFEGVGVKMEFVRETAYLSLGSSLGDKKGYLDLAFKKLAETRGIEVRRRSAYLETEPYGGVATQKFLNAAAEIETYLPPRALLAETQRIESECGRVRTVRWGDRTLDIDIIFYGDRVVREKDLVIPHPEYAKRDFVLKPLRAIAGDFCCPVLNKRIKDL